jgi:hypothetical protein
MERTAVACELRPARSAVEFSVAGPEDDAEIRRLLRENPMRGAVSISLEREPSYFAGCSLGAARDITIVARKSGRLVCVGNCSIRKRFINGEPVQVGYLGGLRLDRSVAGRFDILRQGYRFFEEIASGEDAEFYFTSIAADNSRARQFLERNLPGMPRYEFIGEFVTLVIPTRQRRRGGNIVRVELDERRFNQSHARYNLAAEWQENEFEELRPFGFGPLQIRDGGRAVAAGVLWDQRAFKQTVVRDYSPLMKVARPFVNAWVRFGGVRLPPIGSALNLAFLSPISATKQAAMMQLLNGTMHVAQASGIELLALGFDARDPYLKVIEKAFRCRTYHSRLYAVRWKTSPALKWDDKLLMPEVALL